MSDRPRRLYYVDDGVPEAGTRFLRESCEERDVDFVPVDPRNLELHPMMQLEPGTMLYRPAISAVAQRTEQYLFGPGVATFYRDADGPFYVIGNYVRAFQHAGVPTPRTVHCHTAERPILERYAKQVGGFPLIFKATGFSGGVGVVRIDSMPILNAMVDFSLAMGRAPLIMAFVPDATHWRLVVVGDRVVSSYRNLTPPEDFRSVASADTADYDAEPPPGLEEVAVRAAYSLRSEMGGVDALFHEKSGRVYVLESNFPCYFAQAQSVTGVDTSGAMVDHLLAKAARLTASS